MKEILELGDKGYKELIRNNLKDSLINLRKADLIIN